MAIHFFGPTKSGDTYYCTLISVYNFDVVNFAHLHHGDDKPKDHMLFPICFAQVARTGSNNNVSLIMVAHDRWNLLCKVGCGGDRHIFWQLLWKKQKNTVSKLVPFLKEFNSSNKARFIFGISRCIYNGLKSSYRIMYSNSVDKLGEHLRTSKMTKVNPARRWFPLLGWLPQKKLLKSHWKNWSKHNFLYVRRVGRKIERESMQSWHVDQIISTWRCTCI